MKNIQQNSEEIYTPVFLLKRIREIKKFVEKEESLEEALSKYCDQDIVVCPNTILAIEAITLLILPFVCDYQLAKSEVECFVLESDWGHFRDELNQPVTIETKGKQYSISSLLSWIKYIHCVYIKDAKFKQLLKSDNSKTTNK